MSKLIQCELFKVFRQKKLYVFMLVLTAAEISAVFQIYREAAGFTGFGPNGQSFPLNVLLNGTFFIPILIAILAAESIAEEYRSGNLKKALLCPVSRMDLLHAKIVSMVTVVAVLLIFLVLSSYVIGTLAFGWGERTVVDEMIYTFSEGIRLVAQIVLLSVPPYLAFGMIVIFIALLTTNPGGSIGAALVLLAVSPLVEGIPQVRSFFIGYQMQVVPFLPLHDMAAMDLWGGLAVSIVYFGVLYAGSVMMIRKKDILI
ncbi:ABC transporter permease [Paenibacillus flagellatus]|uniref:ABC transporter permease n=1 Tax=Paenibacillus flagellatus TaxID=2211139 RepID=UPI00130540BB|nr:ABC transporter permease [Paenibacillus flagellatus]